MLVAVADYDLVVGSRYLPDSKIFQFARSRYWASKIANIFLRIILGVPVRDITGGFKCFKAKTLAKINFSEILSWGHFFQAEINYRVFCNKGKISEIPIFFQGRKQGDSKVSLTTIIDFIWSLLLLLKQRFFAV
jgi:dolichol-phosphate mannosyltransferase